MYFELGIFDLSKNTQDVKNLTAILDVVGLVEWLNHNLILVLIKRANQIETVEQLILSQCSLYF